MDPSPGTALPPSPATRSAAAILRRGPRLADRLPDDNGVIRPGRAAAGGGARTAPGQPSPWRLPTALLRPGALRATSDAVSALASSPRPVTPTWSLRPAGPLSSGSRLGLGRPLTSGRPSPGRPAEFRRTAHARLTAHSGPTQSRPTAHSRQTARPTSGLGGQPSPDRALRIPRIAAAPSPVMIATSGQTSLSRDPAACPVAPGRVSSFRCRPTLLGQPIPATPGLPSESPRPRVSPSPPESTAHPRPPMLHGSGAAANAAAGPGSGHPRPDPAMAVITVPSPVPLPSAG